MLMFVVRRIAYIVPIAIGVSLICFALVYLAPGDPTSAMIPDDTPPDLVAQFARPTASTGHCRCNTCCGSATSSSETSGNHCRPAGKSCGKSSRR